MFSRHVGQYGADREHDDGDSGSGTKTLDLDKGKARRVRMTGPCTFALTNPRVGTTYLIRMVADATGGFAPTWPSSIDWGLTGAPAALAANKGQLIALYWEGTKYLASVSTIYY